MSPPSTNPTVKPLNVLLYPHPPVVMVTIVSSQSGTTGYKESETYSELVWGGGGGGGSLSKQSK